MLALPGEAECFPLWWVKLEQQTSCWQLATSVRELKFHILSIQDIKLKIACTLCRKLTPPHETSTKGRQCSYFYRKHIKAMHKWKNIPSARTTARCVAPARHVPQHLTQRWNRLTLEEHVNVVDVQWGASIVLPWSSWSHLGAWQGVNLKEVRYT